MDCKEDISDSDSGIMLHSGSDSPTSPMKDLTTHTQAMRLKHQDLEERLGLCLLELRKLCIREAELTGKLSPDYPLGSDQKPPQIRRRVGTSFKLDEGLIHQDGEESVLQSLEAELFLQGKICEAARGLLLEENLSKSVKKGRVQQCKRQERKMRDLQEAVFQHRVRHGCQTPQTCHAKQRDLSISDDSSLSDAAAMDDESDFSPSLVQSLAGSPRSSLSPSHSTYPSSQSVSLSVTSSTSSLEYQRCPIQNSTSSLEFQRCPIKNSTSSLEFQRCPVQNSPWSESSLDQPYQKSKKPTSASSSRSSSPSGTPVQADVNLHLADLPPPMQLVSMRNLALSPTVSMSAPSTPELPVRRQLSQSFRLPKSKPDFGTFSPDQGRERPRLPRRRVGELAVASPEYSPLRLCQSSSEESSSEHSVPSYASSPCREGSVKTGKPIPPPYAYHLSSQLKGTPAGEAHGFKNNGQHNGQRPAPNNEANVNRNNQRIPGTNNDALNNKNNQHYPASINNANNFKNNQQHPTPNGLRVAAKEGSSLEAEMGKLRVDPPSPARPAVPNNSSPKDVPLPKRAVKPPPPAYTRLVRTPSLKEYPTHASRLLLPREIVCEELKSWHQRNNSLRGPRPLPLVRQGSLRVKRAPNREPPAYGQAHAQKQAPLKVILQRAPDGTPLQWFEEEDAEIVSQV